MKNLKFFALLFVAFAAHSINAQVSISITGETPDPSAILDLQSTDKGLLLPRLTIAERDLIPNPATGLLVFITDNAQFQFYTGSTWVVVGDLGNPDKIADADGDTKIEVEHSPDEDTIRFTINGNEMLRLDGTTMFLDDGRRNVFIGEGVAPASFPVNDNVMIGYQTGSESQLVVQTVAIGKEAGKKLNSAGYNTLIGARAGLNSTNAFFNTFIGTASGEENTTGDDNVYLGYNSGHNATGSKNIFIGSGAGFNEAGSHKLYIESSTSASPLIYGEFDNDLLRFNGTLDMAEHSIHNIDTAEANYFIGDGSGLTGISALGDNLGNHTASQTLNLNENDITNGRLIFAEAFVGNGSALTDIPGDNLGNHTATQTLYLNNHNISGGGLITASAFAGDGSALTNVPGDNLGSHTATQTLNLNNHDITNGGMVTASAFVGDGSGLTGIAGDNLGDHMVTQALNLNGNYLSGDGDAEGIMITSSGNVGINVSDPTTPLGIFGNGAPNNVGITQNQVIGGATMELTTPDALGDQATRIGITGGTNHEDVVFFSGARGVEASRMIINGSTGYVGIGTNTPDSRLDLAGGNISMNGGYLSNDGDNEGVFVATNGHVGIGTTTPSSRLDIAGGNISLNEGWISNDGDSEGIVIGNNGRVGIGTLPYPATKFLVTGDNNWGYTALFESTGTPSALAAIGPATSNPVFFVDAEGSIPLFTVLGNGNVGIGISSPTNGKLQILGQSGSASLSYGYLNSSGNTGTGSGTASYSLYCSNRIAAQEFRAHSDIRIKNIKGVSNAEADLSTLMQIEITDYTMRDTVANASTPQKKVIAQQIEKVYPQAVTSNLTEVVPDIYKRAEIKDGWIMLPTDLKSGDRVKIITDTRSEVYDVSEVESQRFKVNDSDLTELPSPLVFVYGREVNDFRTVDYEAIAMLNVSATQELAREIKALQTTIEHRDQEIESLMLQMANIKSHIEEFDELKSSYIKMCKDIELLKSHLSNSQLVSIETVRDGKK